MTREPNPIELAAAQLPLEKVERPGDPNEIIIDYFGENDPLVDRLLGAQAAQRARAWRELDNLPVPQTTFVDKNGLPAYAIRSDGTLIEPMKSTFGKRELVADDTEVGADLLPLKREIEVVWSGSIPPEWRTRELRSQSEEEQIAVGYDKAANTFGTPEPEPTTTGLTARESEVVGLLAQGVNDRAIAKRLGIAYSSVKSFIHEAKHKRGVGSRQALVAWWREEAA